MMYKSMFLVLGILSSCGGDSPINKFGQKIGVVPKSECEDELDSEKKAFIEETYALNQAARDAAVEAERQRLGVEPVLPSIILGTDMDYDVFAKPEEDPFPESLVAVGETHDVREDGYEINHGKMGRTRIYETAPDSGEYFIVDRIGGDGIGGNGQEVVAESAEYGLFSRSTGADGYSWHSWHSDANNVIVRATQTPVDDQIDEVKVCGCLPGHEEVAALKMDMDMAQPVYTIAIFMLPGSELPRISDDVFNAEFPRKYIKKVYTPRPGKKCKEVEWVC